MSSQLQNCLESVLAAACPYALIYIICMKDLNSPASMSAVTQPLQPSRQPPCNHSGQSPASCRKVDGQLERGEDPYRFQVDKPEDEMTKPARSAKVCVPSWNCPRAGTLEQRAVKCQCELPLPLAQYI